MFKLLVILFIIKLYARVNIFGLLLLVREKELPILAFLNYVTLNEIHGSI